VQDAPEQAELRAEQDRAEGDERRQHEAASSNVSTLNTEVGSLRTVSAS
jgi:hypothetical protein